MQRAWPLRTCHDGITQCYLPPGRGDIPACTPAEAGTRFRDPGGMQGWAVRDIAVEVRSPCQRLHIAVAVVINTTTCVEIRTWVPSHRSRTRWPLGHCDLWSPLNAIQSCTEHDTTYTRSSSVEIPSRLLVRYVLAACMTACLEHRPPAPSHIW